MTKLLTKTQAFFYNTYLEYVNDFLTVAYMAEYKGISENALRGIIDEGKRLAKEYELPH
jgi:predicted DNA-binding protein YlxM (UPF0122 family)